MNVDSAEAIYARLYEACGPIAVEKLAKDEYVALIVGVVLDAKRRGGAMSSKHLSATHATS